MQNRDLPIHDFCEDKLNFEPFAKKVAQGILNYKQTETFVLSIEGQWGSGKTSLINLIEKELQNNLEEEKSLFAKVLDKFMCKDEGDIKIIHFKPWMMLDLNQLIKVFFEEIVSALSNNQIGKYLDEFEKKLTIDNVKFKVPLAQIEYKFNNDTSDGLENLKIKINEILKKIGKKIIIIVDDIDRLTDKETEFVFRFTKSIANFDNLVYILLYDKEVVSKSLETFKREKGEKYLDKIVQYSLHVPKAHKITLQNILFEKLAEIISQIEEKETTIFFDKYKWSYVVSHILNKNILTIRDVNKIINIISFEYPLISQDVNFTDFFLISLLRINNNSLYEEIQNFSNKLLMNPETIVLDSEKKRTKENLQNLIQQYYDYEEILTLLFPFLEENEFGDRKECIFDDHKNKYLADLYYFENYFSLSVPTDKLQYKDFKEVENSFLSSDFEQFKEKILILDKQKKCLFFSAMFESNSLNNLSNQNKLINGFYNAVKISYQLEDGKFDKEMKWLYVNPTANYIWLAYKIVHKIGNQNEFLSKFFIDNNEVPLLIKIEMFKTIQERVEKYKEFHLEETLIEKIYDRLKDNLSQITLEEFLKDDLIETHILSRYESFHLSLEKMSNELNEYIFKTQNNFFNILQKFKYWQLSSSGSRWLIDKTSLKKLINLNEINNYTIDLHKKNLDSNEKELLEIWERKNE